MKIVVKGHELAEIDEAVFEHDLPLFLQQLCDVYGGVAKPSAIRELLQARYFYQEDNFRAVRHPLVINIGGVRDLPETELLGEDFTSEGHYVAHDVALRFLMAGAQCLEALKEKDWHGFVFQVERPFRLEALHWVVGNHASDMTSEFAEELLYEVYIDSEHPSNSRDIWLLHMNALRPFRPNVHTDDAAEFASLPETLAIYRGSRHPEEEVDNGEIGISWTLDWDRARWFAKRWSDEEHEPGVIKATVKKADLFAYLTGRNEKECVIDPDKLEILSVETI